MLIPFDILYEGFCNRIRSSDKTDRILQSMKKEGSDQVRVHALLNNEPDLLSLLDRNISDCFEGKNENISRRLWERGVEGNSLTLLTEAISYCPLPDSFEEKVVSAFDQHSPKVHVLNFMEGAMKENGDDLGIMSRMFYDKACILFSRRKFMSALKDFIRAWLMGFSKTLNMTYQVAVCCYEGGELDIAKELLQCSAQYLRTMPLSNENKSEWTMNIVKVLKAIEAMRKVNSKSKCQTSQLDSAIEMANVNNGMRSFSDLYLGASDTVSVASKSVTLKFTHDKGRHLVATENIPPGSTIISEMPYAWTISKANYHKFCLWCLHRIESGIPCSSCASAIFCNATCRGKAIKSFHGKECRIMKLLDSSQKLGNMALLCFRTLLMTPLSTLQDFTSKQYCFSNETLDSSSFFSVFAQTPNSEQRQAGDLLKRTVSAIYLTLCLKYTGYLGSNSQEGDDGKNSKQTPNMTTEKTESVDINVVALILRQLQSASCNAYGINCIERKIIAGNSDEEYNKQLSIGEIGGATFPVISTTNHSCNPSAYRVNIPGKGCVVKTLRDIIIGEEIYDCYGPLYLTEPRTERINKLQTQYLFRCNCKSCTENWPTYGTLRTLPLQYKCSNCKCALSEVDDKNVCNKLKCPYCDHVMHIKKLMNALSKQKERFSLAKATILSENFDPFDKDMEAIICEYIRICQMAFMDPCMTTVEAQEILKLFWNVSIRNL